MAWTSPRTWVTGETVTAAQMNAHVRDNLDALNPLDSVGATSWSPTLEATTTNPTTSGVSGRYWRVGPLVFAWARFVLASSGDGSGTYFVTLPITASGVTGSGTDGQVVGSWRGFDSSTGGNSASGACLLRSTSVVGFGLPTGTQVTNSTPFTWTLNDVLTFSVFYPAA